MRKIGVIVLICVIMVTFVVLLILRSNEDYWMKDSRGVWTEHGNPSSTPEHVYEQQSLIRNVSSLYVIKKAEIINGGENLSSQCLGTIGEYAIDIVHDPRTEEDDLAENQCPDYLDGTVTHFVELDKSGDILRIV